MAELTRLGRYQITNVLGRGAMGVVYEGLDPRLNRRVAIKTILKNAAIDAETAQAYSAQFHREAQAAGRLNHPNIVHVHDFAEEGDIAYLVMEYIQGRELRGYFDAGEKFDLAEAVRIMGELLDALHYAHEAGVIHRDVKPANVMLDAEKRVKLADFGVARIQDSERSAAGTMVGTPAFMSPEQIQGQRIDRRTDVFSAGVVFYQLLTGEQPFAGAGAWTVARKIMQDDPPRPSTVVTSVSPEFDAIVNKALAKKPGERYATAREFATDLRAALGGVQPAANASLPPSAVAKPRAGARASEAEVEFWKAIQNSTDAAEFEFYLEQFPEGTYAALARHKIARLTSSASPAAATDTTLRLEAEAAEKERRDAQAEALARLKQQEEARPQATPDPEATVAMPRQAQRAAAPSVAVEQKKKSFLVPALLGAAVVIAGVAAFYSLVRKPAPAPEFAAPAPVAAPAPTPARPAAPSVDEEKIRREAEERIRREYAEKSAAEQAAAAKAAAEKAAAEKQATAAKAAAEKVAAAKVAAERAAAEKALAEKLEEARRAGERAAQEKAAVERAAAEKTAMEKAAAEKAAAEKAAAEKLVAAKVAAGRSQAALLEKFKQRVGANKVVSVEPPATYGALAWGDVVYVNDGSCPRGQIREVIGGSRQRGESRQYRCIPLE